MQSRNPPIVLCVEDIKPKHGLSHAHALEFCYLELRFICELVALASLVAHGDIQPSIGPTIVSGKLSEVVRGSHWYLAGYAGCAAHRKSLSVSRLKLRLHSRASGLRISTEN